VLKTERLILIPATEETVRAEQQDHQRLAVLLNASIPEDWPPETLSDALPWFEEQLHRYPKATGWYGWYALLNSAGKILPVLAGGAGFKGAPDANGQVEIGYSVLPSFQKRGLASEMVRALTDWAFRQPGTGCIIARTAPDNAPSIRVLRKAGFNQCEGSGEPGLILFRLERTGQNESRR
jgi:[ribosomal protein S5]-alanine N-acetyltransferase